MGNILKNSNYAACTIVSKNYFAYARTLYYSFRRHNPEAQFFVLLVDKNDGDIDFSKESFEVLEASTLGVEDFIQVAFRFDILELNTNVKPTFLKFLLKERDISRLLYLDPDILIYQPMNAVFEFLNLHEIVLTPHCNSPIKDALRPSEQDFLISGVFNLGFVGVRNTPESLAFLDWWENRCLTLGFSETRAGLFVDQKWVNFAPCFFDNVHVLKHPGCNMAYWNLHERILEHSDGKWMVNGQALLFFHFSGIDIHDKNQISRHQNRFDLSSRSDLQNIFEEYRSLLLKNGFEAFKKLNYSYGKFSNGVPITQMARRLYAVNEAAFSGQDPFLSTGNIYRWCKLNGFLGGNDESGKYNSITYRENDLRITFIHSCLRLLLKIIGSNRYTLLMKYFSYISILRNQKCIFRA